MAEFSDKLLEAKEVTIDPLKQFYAGPKRIIYDDARTFLRDEEPNFSDVAGTEATELREILASAVPYKGNTLQQAKTKLETLRGEVVQVITKARADAAARVEQARSSVRVPPDFTALAPEEQSSVLKPFATAIEQLQKERLAPVIRQIADRIANETLPRQLQMVGELAASKKPGSLKEPPVQYVSARHISIVFSKAILESEADLDTYLIALKKAYTTELKSNNRITL